MTCFKIVGPQTKHQWRSFDWNVTRRSKLAAVFKNLKLFRILFGSADTCFGHFLAIGPVMDRRHIVIKTDAFDYVADIPFLARVLPCEHEPSDTFLLILDEKHCILPVRQPMLESCSLSFNHKRVS